MAWQMSFVAWPFNWPFALIVHMIYCYTLKFNRIINMITSVIKNSLKKIDMLCSYKREAKCQSGTLIIILAQQYAYIDICFYLRYIYIYIYIHIMLNNY